MQLKFYQYAADAPSLDRLWHVTINYQTHSGNPATWGRWVSGADNIDHAIQVASRHVSTFKRLARIYGGNAASQYDLAVAFLRLKPSDQVANDDDDDDDA